MLINKTIIVFENVGSMKEKIKNFTNILNFNFKYFDYKSGTLRQLSYFI